MKEFDYIEYVMGYFTRNDSIPLTDKTKPILNKYRNIWDNQTVTFDTPEGAEILGGILDSCVEELKEII